MIEYNKTIGTKYIICPYAKIETEEDIDELVDLFRDITPKIQKAGMGVGYHNHNHELVKFNGEYGLDILMRRTEKMGIFLRLMFFGLNLQDFVP